MRVVAFPLHPGLGPAGVPLTQLLRGVDLGPAHARLKAIGDGEGLAFVPSTTAWDSRLAQELAAWAGEHHAALRTAVDAALFRAVFVEGRNIGDVEVLVAIASEVGLPADAARTVVTDRTHRAAVDRDWAFARQVGVTGVPTYAIDGRGVVGAQPYEVLVKLAEAAGVARRA